MISFFTASPSNFLPINLLTAKKVFSALVTPCRFADIPTNFSPLSVKATTDGVVLAPSKFSNTFGVAPSITATHEFVVPKSIPIIFDIIFIPFLVVLVLNCVLDMGGVLGITTSKANIFFSLFCLI